MSTPTPNKLTLVAAGLFSVTNPPKGKTWANISAEAKAPCIAAAEFLAGQTFGADVSTVDQPKLAAIFEKTEMLKGSNANTVVSVFVNITAALG
jgi:hypothetical protein